MSIRFILAVVAVCSLGVFFGVRAVDHGRQHLLQDGKNGLLGPGVATPGAVGGRGAGGSPDVTTVYIHESFRNSGLDKNGHVVTFTDRQHCRTYPAGTHYYDAWPASPGGQMKWGLVASKRPLRVCSK